MDMAFKLYKSRLVAILELPEGFISPREIGKMRDAVRAELVEGTDKLVVDLGRATSLNSMLIGVLVEMYTSFTNISGQILFAAPNHRAQNLLQALRLDRVFEIVTTVDHALHEMEKRHTRASA